MKKLFKHLLPLLTAVLMLSACTQEAVTTSEYPPASQSSADVSSAEESSREDSKQEESSKAQSYTVQNSDEPSGQSKADTSGIYRLSEKYFVSRLGSRDLTAFAELYNAVTANESRVKFSVPVEENKLDQLMMLLNYDCPELIHVTGDYSTTYSDETEEYISGVYFYYNMTPDEYSGKLAQLEAYFSALRTELEGRSDYEKEKYVYDKLFSECIYNETDKNSGSVYGALIEHSARCEGISKALMWCLRELGIECITVVGTPEWDSDSLYGNHSWNLARLDGSWYHIDLTADNMKSLELQSDPPLYGFLNTDDDIVYQTRTLSMLYQTMGVPECSSMKLNYHVMNGLFISEGEDIRERLYGILDDRLEAASGCVFSLRLETKGLYNSCVNDWEELLNEYFDSHRSQKYDDTIYYNSVSQTVAFVITPL